jgi:hypothetical protein
VTLYTAGQKVRAAELNTLPQMSNVVSDQVNASTTFANVAGMSFSADASTRYFIEFFISYLAAIERDMKLQLQFPVGTTGWFTARGIDAAAPAGANAGSTGDFNGQSLGPNGVHAFAGSSGAGLAPADPANGMFCSPSAMLLTSTLAGTIQLQFALLATGSGAGNCTIKAGSGMRVTKLTT